jgi:hypothetical protein
MIGCWASSPVFHLIVDLKTKNHFPYFNFLKIRETLVHAGIRDWKRKKSNIKEREYLLNNIKLYIYINTRARWVFKFWDSFGVF